MNNIISVSQLNRYVKSLFDQSGLLNDIFIQGEISNFKNHYSSGHMYFSLKDKTATVKAVMFSSYASLLKFMPEDGMEVVVHGSVSIYERDGAYQVYVKDMIPYGAGALSVAYEQLKEKLYAEGLFSELHKKPIPQYPENIAVVTAKDAAALQDVLNILKRRYPIGNVRVYPVLVQGKGASESISKALEYIQKENICDLVILARGGGSLEDLWAFNEEKTVRAVYSCKIPIITGVGHETDFTLCDFASDLRAATPSESAELAARSISEISQDLDRFEERLNTSLENKIENYENLISVYSEEYLKELMEKNISEKENNLGQIKELLQSKIKNYINKKDEEFKNLVRVFEGVSPLSALSRGYTITENTNKSNLKDTKPGDVLITRSGGFSITSEVIKVSNEDKLEGE